ncbi:amino acid ABC transporter substrate-binding protein [Paenarthrobacter sp. CM16]|uniref:substrate-binding periplasmic protein n=1 Tax=Paenarthrobacter sp. CM16 TaxID=2738447 RepID=UPI0015525A1F|nr:ABC transporter substrate-binding protein [Paenarthrobacter sp. CM16]NQD87794.1 amino acid ABC transporter substrate-binding protein [Paenarthrobacter sp. CM16]
MKSTWIRKSAPIAVAAGLALSMSACGGDSSADAVSSSCTPKHTFTTITPGTLTVATYDFQPHVKIEGDKISGVEGDLLNEIAKRECLTVSVQSAGGAAAAVPSVQSGRADLAAGDWWRTTARSKVVELSSPVYLDQGAIVSKSGYKTIAELDGKKVGSVVGNLWNDQFKQLYADSFSVYQDPEAAFSDLAAGRIDAVVDSVGATTARFQTNPVDGAQIVPLEADTRIPVSAHPGQLNWPTSKNNADLTNALNANIEELRKEGIIAETLKKYGMDPSAAEVGEPDLL